jgi:UDP-2,3-diacylglucosamine pyrophosphatase LpxH
MEIRKALIIPDCHIPYEHKPSYDLMLEIATDQDRIDEIVILGDYADFYDISSHPKDPNVGSKLIDEVDAVIARLWELRALFPKAKITYIEGNHEYRLGRYIRDNCKEFFGLISVEMLLNLPAMKINLIPYGPNQKHAVLNSKLMARHEPIGGGTHCAFQTVSKAMESVIFGHTHRIQEYQIVSMDGEMYRGISCGWLGDETNPVMSYVKNHHQWARGFSILNVLPDGTWFNNLIHIIKGKALYNGKLYVAKG